MDDGAAWLSNQHQASSSGRPHAQAHQVAVLLIVYVTQQELLLLELVLTRACGHMISQLASNNHEIYTLSPEIWRLES